jgi:hypothetical protein
VFVNIVKVEKHAKMIVLSLCILIINPQRFLVLHFWDRFTVEVLSVCSRNCDIIGVAILL